MPGLEHRHCVKHISENFKLVFKDLVYKNLLWAAAGAGNKKSWQYQMDKLKELDAKAYEWLMQRDPATWARAFFFRIPSLMPFRTIYVSLSTHILKLPRRCQF